MATFARDPYYAALFERLKLRVPSVQTWSRRALTFAKLPAGAQPAGVLLVGTQASVHEPNAPRTWTLGADLVLFVRATGQEESLDTVLNELVDQVEAALLREADEAGTAGPFQQVDHLHSTLNGLVHEVSIGGAVEFYQAEGGEQATVIIPIDMVVLGDW